MASKTITKAYDCIQYDNEQDWLDARVISGSVIGQLFGHNKYGSIWDTWARLTKHESYKPSDQTWAMRRGHHLEMPIAEEVARDLGYPSVSLVQSNHEIYRTIDRPWETCSPDVCIVGKDDDGFWGIREVWEIKSRGGYTAESISQTSPPDYEVDQLKWCMKIMQVDKGRLCIEATDGVAVFTYHRDPEWEARAQGLAEDFYRVHVEGGKPPLIDGSEACTAALRASQSPSDEIMDLDAEWHGSEEEIEKAHHWYSEAMATLKLLRGAMKEKKAIEEQEKRLKNEVRAILDGRKGLRCELGSITMTQRKSSPSWGKIAQALKAYVSEDVWEQQVAAHTSDEMIEYPTCRWKE